MSGVIFNKAAADKSPPPHLSSSGRVKINCNEDETRIQKKLHNSNLKKWEYRRYTQQDHGWRAFALPLPLAKWRKKGEKDIVLSSLPALAECK